MNGTIYFIENEEHVKIGFTTDLYRRLKELQTGNGVPLRILYIIEDVDLKFEAHMHKVCEAYKTHGEWFEKEVINFLLEKSSPWFKENMIRPKRKPRN